MSVLSPTTHFQMCYMYKDGRSNEVILSECQQILVFSSSNPWIAWRDLGRWFGISFEGGQPLGNSCECFLAFWSMLGVAGAYTDIFDLCYVSTNNVPYCYRYLQKSKFVLFHVMLFTFKPSSNLFSFLSDFFLLCLCC